MYTRDRIINTLKDHKLQLQQKYPISALKEKIVEVLKIEKSIQVP
jgi:hypothetical protein